MTTPKQIDGWNVVVMQQHDLAFPWRAEATDDFWARTEISEGFDIEDVLCSLAQKTGIDRKELLAEFGL